LFFVDLLDLQNTNITIAIPKIPITLFVMDKSKV
jgi:hypothetical protein